VVIGLLIAGAVTLLQQREQRAGYVSTPFAPPPPRPQRNVAVRLKRLDPTFSETVFIDWATLLFARVHETRARRDLDAVGLFLSSDLQDRLRRTPDEGRALRDIVGLAVGGVRLEGLRRSEGDDRLALDASFRASYTAEFEDGSRQAFWTDELWTFSRRANVTSRPPEAIERQGCPGCGSPLERTSLGRCVHCQASLAPGESDWCVAARQVRELRKVPPVLTGVVEEVGTELPTIFQPGLKQKLQALTNLSPTRFDARVRHVFLSLQKGWSEARLEAIRPFETDALFGQHRFWIEEYTRQGLRNRLENVRLTQVELVKAEQDMHFDALTCRLHASARDVTIRLADQRVVGGDPRRDRVWTEYWTFVRRRGAAEVANEVTCPSCMAPLQVAQSGVCAYCQTKLTRGDFDWVLSRIEQDEEYQG
jgi:predicted lipid-binding transport protein (Tim44 family)